MAQWVSVREAADILGVSQDTVKRKLKAGTLPGRKETGEKGERWLVELPDDATATLRQDQDSALGAALQQVIDVLSRERDELWQEVASRRREVEELHILLQRSQEQVRALAPPQQSRGSATVNGVATPPQQDESLTETAMAGAMAASRPWWKVWARA